MLKTEIVVFDSYLWFG